MSALQGKVALITGSTSGIGLGLAQGLAAAGARIALNGLAGTREATALCRDIEHGYQVEARFFEADLARGVEAEGLVEQTLARMGRLDILINNAGIQHVAAVEDFPAERWESLIALNLSAAFYTIRTALPAMKRQGFGRIINIASAHGLVASPYKSAYVAAKHGLIGLTKAVGLEVAEEADLTVNAICPGYVRTPLVENQIADQAKAHGLNEEEVIRQVILAAQPNKRFVTTEELSALVLLLCSPEGRSFNGAALPMDGGWTAR